MKKLVDLFGNTGRQQLVGLMCRRSIASRSIVGLIISALRRVQHPFTAPVNGMAETFIKTLRDYVSVNHCPML
ncbi:hypothetical protein FHR76_004634 [Rhizobium sp. RAS22]|nr:hypothetical protein [Rhizobium sp. RAS22]